MAGLDRTYRFWTISTVSGITWAICPVFILDTEIHIGLKSPGKFGKMPFFLSGAAIPARSSRTPPASKSLAKVGNDLPLDAAPDALPAVG